MAIKFLRGLQYTTGTNGRDIPIFLNLAYNFWAYCVNGAPSILTVTAASNTNPIVITTSTPHGLSNNQLVGVYGVQGNTSANGGFNVTVVNSTQFALNGAVGNANYTTGGQVTIPGGIPISPTSSPSGFFEGSSVLAVGNDGVTSALGDTFTAASSQPFSQSMIGKHIVVWLAGARSGIAPGSAGFTLPQSTLNVQSTIGFPASGSVFVQSSTGLQTVNYTGILSTTIAAGSNGQVLPQATINVASTTGFPTSGVINVVTSNNVPQVVTYTGVTATTFTGCSGGTGTMTTGNAVTGQTFVGCSGGTGLMQPNGSVSVNPPSTDDSIYRIVAVPSNTQIKIVPFSGGTTDISSLKNNLTARASLSYRVLDVIAASQLSIGNGNYFIGNFTGAPNINPGAAVSQFQMLLRGSANAFGQMGYIGSPNGSWNGTSFSGSGSNTTMSERISATNFTGTTSAVSGFVSFIADTDFFFGHVKSPTNGGNTTGLYFMITTPARLYTQTQDPNLIAILAGGNTLNNSTGTDSFCTSFGMVGFDGTTRSHQLISRNLVGDTANATIGPTYTVGFNLNTQLGYQNKIAKVITGETLMAVSSAAGQFSFARARMRPHRVTFGGLPPFFLIGDRGEFIHLVNGICLPWDGAILPYNFLASGA
jgi:hypothetical protein